MRCTWGDYVLAYMWFDIAAALGNKWSATERDNVATNMTPAEIAEAQRMAREWAPKVITPVIRPIPPRERQLPFM